MSKNNLVVSTATKIAKVAPEIFMNQMENSTNLLSTVRYTLPSGIELGCFVKIPKSISKLQAAKELRNLGLSQKTIAHTLKISQAQVSRLINEK